MPQRMLACCQLLTPIHSHHLACSDLSSRECAHALALIVTASNGDTSSCRPKAPVGIQHCCNILGCGRWLKFRWPWISRALQSLLDVFDSILVELFFVADDRRRPRRHRYLGVKWKVRVGIRVAIRGERRSNADQNMDSANLIFPRGWTFTQEYRKFYTLHSQVCDADTTTDRQTAKQHKDGEV